MAQTLVNTAAWKHKFLPCSLMETELSVHHKRQRMAINIRLPRCLRSEVQALSWMKNAGQQTEERDIGQSGGHQRSGDDENFRVRSER